MAFTPLDSALIATGKPVVTEIFTTIKGDLDDLNTRTGHLETNAARIDVFRRYLTNGSSFTSATGLEYFEAHQAFTLTEAAIRIFTVGSMTGNIEIDILKSTTLTGTYTSVFTTKPKIVLSGATDGQVSTNKVFNSGQISIAKGNFLRLDITQATTSGVLPRLLIDVYGE